MAKEKEIIVVSEETPSEQIISPCEVETDEPDMAESRITDVSTMKTDERGVALLKEMYEIFSPSGGEHAMVVFVSNWLIANGITPKVDSAGNIYAQNKIRGSKRIIVNAHMDTVASKPADIQVLHAKKDVILSSTNKQVIGADDKNGVWCILRLLTDPEIDTPLTALFCVAEESGCNGSQFAMDNHADYFDDCVFNITVDRRGDTDIIIENCDITLCSKEMQAQLSEWGKPFGLRTTQGSISDVSNIVEHLKINGINLFAGYHGAHMGTEYTSLRELLKSYTFQKYLLPELHKHFMLNPDSVEFKDFQRLYVYPSYGAYGTYKYGDYTQTTTHYSASQRKSFGSLDEMDIIEKFEEVIDDIDLKSSHNLLYREMIDAEYELSHSKKSLKIMNGWVLMPDALKTLEYYFTIGSNKNLDGIIPVKEIEHYLLTFEDDKPKYTGVDKGGYDSHFDHF